MGAGRIDAVVTGVSHIFPRLLVEHARLYFFMSKAHERMISVQAPLVYNDGRSPMKAPQKITGVVLSDVTTFIDTHSGLGHSVLQSDLSRTAGWSGRGPPSYTIRVQPQ